MRVAAATATEGTGKWQVYVCHGRSKRSLLSFRMPFTKWCGAHYDANTYGDLGGLVRVDHCCRQHDLHCPYFIEFMTEKYGLWNTHLGTINHCGCDLRSVEHHTLTAPPRH